MTDDAPQARPPTSRRRQSVALAAAILAFLAAVGLALWHRSRTPDGDLGQEPDLFTAVADREVEAEKAVLAYAPLAPQRLEDRVGEPASQVLRPLPGVVGIESLAFAPNATGRIVHLRNRPLVPRDLFAADVQATGADLDRLYDAHLRDVAALQFEQLAVLRCLVRWHGVQRVWCEGLTDDDLPAFRLMIAAVRQMDREQLPFLRAWREEAHSLRRGRAIEQEILQSLREHELRLLELGVAGRLVLLEGDGGLPAEAIMPLDDADTGEASRPRPGPDGELATDPEQKQRREDAIVARLKGQRLAVIVLGGDQNLGDSVRRVAPEMEYVRFSTAAWWKAAGMARTSP